MENFDSKVAAKALKVARIARDYTTRKVAEYAQVSPSYISDVENGKKRLTLNTLKKLSSAYNISASQMVELIEYCESLETSEENELRKYQLALIKVLKMYLNIN